MQKQCDDDYSVSNLFLTGVILLIYFLKLNIHSDTQLADRLTYVSWYTHAN